MSTRKLIKGDRYRAGLWKLEAITDPDLPPLASLDIRVDAFLTTVECDYPSFHLTMHCYLCTVVSGSLVLKEHESAAWLGADELDRVAWLPADVEVVKEIKKRGA